MGDGVFFARATPHFPLNNHLRLPARKEEKSQKVMSRFAQGAGSGCRPAASPSLACPTRGGHDGAEKCVFVCSIEAPCGDSSLQPRPRLSLRRRRCTSPAPSTPLAWPGRRRGHSSRTMDGLEFLICAASFAVAVKGLSLLSPCARNDSRPFARRMPSPSARPRPSPSESGCQCAGNDTAVRKQRHTAHCYAAARCGTPPLSPPPPPSQHLHDSASQRVHAWLQPACA